MPRVEGPRATDRQECIAAAMESQREKRTIKSYFIVLGILSILAGGYHVIALDRENYGYSMVTGPSRSYLRILSRNEMLDQKIVAELVARAKQWDFDTEKLIYVEHDKKEGNQ